MGPLNVEGMTGLREDKLDALVVAVAERIGPFEVARLEALGLHRSVVAVLAYQRQNATEEFLAAIFDVSQPTISRRITLLEAPIGAVLESFVPDPVEATKGDVLLVDGTLVGTSDWSDQDDLFSGKHRKAGFNVQVAANLSGQLIAVGAPVHGSRHDAHAWHASGLADRLASQDLLADLGYVGVEGIHTGTRRPPGGRLTDRQATANRSLSALRAAVERAIAHLKNWKILKIGYRRPLDRFHTVLKTVTALHFYEYSNRELQPS